jgi:hypothetical protein
MASKKKTPPPSTARSAAEAVTRPSATHLDGDASPPVAPKPARRATRAKPAFMRVARPDTLDPRDRPFRPNIGRAPAPTLFPKLPLAVRHQGDTNACTGFGLSLVVEHLLLSSGRERKPAISPFMLYSMARRYDEFPGSTEDDGSSLRGALKGWFKHGACGDTLFPGLEMPAASKSLKDDWWFDAVKRPLGAYYRIDPKAITDMHAALNEVGILYVSAGCHAGWDDGIEVKQPRSRPTSFKNVWEIPVKPGQAAHAGHAFAIVGYNERGFLIQNSWGTDWGTHGYAILSYDDWLTNAMDCWVAQLGVVTQDHTAISRSISLRTDKQGRVALAASQVLRNREISPFIVNMGNNGELSNSGVFRTRPDDLRALVDVHLAEARKRWELKADEPIDVCVYAHGGLVGEEAAADIAAKWIPLLYGNRIFPVFLMWETGFFTTALNCIEDAVRGVPRTVGGRFSFEAWWNERLERLMARPGSRIWGLMKKNADLMSAEKPDASDEEQAGGLLLYRQFKQGANRPKVRMHFVGHSAGSIVASHMIDRLARDGMRFESASFMAPAVTVADFDRLVRPQLDSGVLERYQQFHLTRLAEEDDSTCGPYRRSLLHLVSRSFEGGTETPILGMQAHFEDYAKASKLSGVAVEAAPGPVSASTSHGGFDDDPGTQRRIVDFILGKA